jgi:hypothetical protein
MFPRIPLLVLAPVVALSIPIAAPHAQASHAQASHDHLSGAASVTSIAELWEQPLDVSQRDLFYGPWGPERSPKPHDTYTFLRKKRQGTNPGVTATDSSGREWHVKQGPEARPEVVLSRVLSAVGYHQPPVYHLPSFTLADQRGNTHLERGGRFRLSEHPTLKTRGQWSWDENPFIGTQPYEGLLVMLVMLNSADLKNDNNTLYEVKDGHGEPTTWFVVRDLGSSLGQNGRFNPREDDPDAFDRHGFITGVKGGFVEFDYHAVHRNLVEHRIRPDDVRWASRLLGMLTDRQWQDAFRAAGYTPPEANRFIHRIHQKIEEGQRLTVEAAQ